MTDPIEGPVTYRAHHLYHAYVGLVENSENVLDWIRRFANAHDLSHAHQEDEGADPFTVQAIARDRANLAPHHKNDRAK